MGEYLSPFSIQEGFTSVIPDTRVYPNSPPPKIPSTAGPINLDPTRINDKHQPMDILYGILTIIEEKIEANPIYTSLLKNLILTEKSNLDDLLRTAKQLNPVIQKITPLDTAYDAAFESASSRPLPAAGATLQGFALLLLVISYVCLVLVSVIAVNILTGSVMTAGKVLVGLLFLGLVGYAILAKYG